MTLQEYFEQHNKVAIAFSGGVDSAYLLYMAGKCASKTTAYYVKSQFQPAFEYDDAMRLASSVGVNMRVIELDVLADSDIASNPANRCYYCKKRIMSAIFNAASSDGYTLVVDGTNASDDVDDRPGFRALKELHIESPLRLCGLTKEVIRKCSYEAGLFTWNKPSYACLATRIETDVTITASDLARTEWAENYLFSLGFRDFRVRLRDGSALVQIREDDMELYKNNSSAIEEKLGREYTSVKLDGVSRVCHGDVSPQSLLLTKEYE